MPGSLDARICAAALNNTAEPCRRDTGAATRSFGKRELSEAADAEIATIPGSNSLKVTKPQFERNGAMMRTEPLCGLDIYPLTLARLPFF